jgi:hypothetical protein
VSVDAGGEVGGDAGIEAAPVAVRHQVDPAALHAIAREEQALVRIKSGPTKSGIGFGLDRQVLRASAAPREPSRWDTPMVDEGMLRRVAAIADEGGAGAVSPSLSEAGAAVSGGGVAVARPRRPGGAGAVAG